MKTEAIPITHEWTGPTGVKFVDVREPSGTFYRDTVPRAVIDALESARMSGARVRLFIGNMKTGECWGDEYDVVGCIGRSMGPIKVPILLHNSNSHGGGAILCDCIVRLMVNGRDAYRHPGYKLPEYTVRRNTDEYKHGLAFGASDANGVVARFKTEKSANNWVKFMRGERMCK